MVQLVKQFVSEIVTSSLKESITEAKHTNVLRIPSKEVINPAPTDDYIYVTLLRRTSDANIIDRKQGFSEYVEVVKNAIEKATMDKKGNYLVRLPNACCGSHECIIKQLYGAIIYCMFNKQP